MVGFLLGQTLNERRCLMKNMNKEVAYKTKFQIKEIDKDSAIEFVVKYHYSPKFPRITKHYLGFFEEGESELIGVVTLGWGTQPKHTINKILPKKEGGYTTTDYYEIGKMCMHPSLLKNSESQMMRDLIVWLKELNKTRDTPLSYLYTMADGIVGKAGYVYQASNFYYSESFWTSVYKDEDGNRFHRRSIRELCEENNNWCKDNYSYWNKDKLHDLTLDFMDLVGMEKIYGLMFRYIYPLSKKAKKVLEESGMWRKGDYPKDYDLRWKKKTIDGLVEIPQPFFHLNN
jgi:hypothetical protein